MPLLSSDYENWASAGKGSPNHEDVRDCVVMSRTTGKWSAINCNDDRAYFYEVGAVSGRLQCRRVGLVSMSAYECMFFVSVYGRVIDKGKLYAIEAGTKDSLEHERNITHNKQ